MALFPLPSPSATLWSFKRLRSAALAIVAGCAFSATSPGQTIATNGSVPDAMNATGTSGTPAVYIIGDGGSYTKAFTGSTTYIGPLIFTPAYTQLLVQNGSTVTIPVGGILALWAPSTTLTVTGSNSRVLLNSVSGNDQFLFSGLSSSGTTKLLEVLDGGLLETNVMQVLADSSIMIDGANSTVYVRDALEFYNTVTLTINLTNGGLFNVASFGNLSATINTTIGDGGTLRVRGNLDVTGRFNSFSFASGGTLKVDGSLSNLGSITSGQTVDLSSGGAFGTSTTLNGGAVTVDDFAMTNLAFTAGTLQVTGSLSNLNTLGSGQAIVLDGGTWSPTGDIDDGDLTLDNSGNLNLVTAFDGSNLTFTSGTLTTSSTLSNLPTLVSGTTVDITGGGTLSDATTLNGGELKVADFTMANLTFTSGTLNTTGALSNLNTLGSGQAVVIDGGTWSPSGSINGGSLTLQNAGAVSVGDYDATNLTFTSGSLTTTGALSNLNTLSSANQTVVIDGGTWSPSGSIDDGNLTLQNAGAVSVGDFDATNLTFTSGTLTTTGALSNLNTLSSANQSVVLDGGTWAPSGNIDDGNLTLANSGTLTLATAFDGSNLTLTSGTLVSTAALTNIPTIGSGVTVNLSGSGAFANAATLDGGQLQVGTFDMNNLTFTSGSLTATGALSGLNALGANQSVILDGGTWSPTGNINSGNLTLQSGAAATVAGGYDGSNLTLTNGDLTISGDASNLPSITTGNTVTLTGGGTLQTATTVNGGALAGGDFDLDGNLTLSSGTLNVSGTLQNLTSLPSGTTVNVSGASAALILNQALNVTGGSLNISNGATVTATSTLTLGAGALSFGSSGGAFDLDNSTLNVASLGAALTLNSNTSITGDGRIFGDINLGTGGTINGDSAAGGLDVFGNVSGSGTLSNVKLYGDLNIGSSPGHIDISDTVLASGSTVFMEILGTGEGEYDTLFGNVGTDVSAANLSIGFSALTPQVGDSWTLFSGSFDPTSWASIALPAGTTLSGYTLTAVPEPDTAVALIALMALGFALTRRHRAGQKN